jgi:cyclase
MLRPRIIASLLVHNRGLVKTQQFTNPKYVGDPINAVKIFNEKEVDELAVFDIDASVNRVEPDYAMIANLAAECRMPLCYGGGVKTVEQVVRIIKLGVEKVAVSSLAIENPSIISEMAKFVGSQSIVVVLDIKRDKAGKYTLWTHNGTKPTNRDPVEMARAIEALGAGEVILNSIDRDGEMKGYDLELARSVRAAVTVPMSVLGGAGKLDDVGALIRELGIVGAAAGSLFVFKGVYRAVLINYPNRSQKVALTTAALAGAGAKT